ncbi:hypothetical protein BEL04_10610 [Mucilaginibacter sp. PPCGB 2223]|uniref:hypothetical protein n=1 Tax=Mucilaginibacter sp. PPCGB 2223 TaxID=1886027 RepID=UPI0008242A4E|nr:hypothetical protein [Mucilaginibacter sp. PPCGB 2223]OCX54668.1 hypothetical protein BEL04_10610 [Mucilaginibacter sp. PPCGB 2223]
MKHSLLLLSIFIGIVNCSYAQYVINIHNNVRINGKVSSIVTKDLYPQPNFTVDTVIFKQIFDNEGQCIREDNSRMYDSHRSDTAALSKEIYRTWHTYYTYHYNHSGRLVKVTWMRDKDDAKGTISFDKQGRPVKDEYISPGNYWTETKKHYDANGNMINQFTYYHDNFMVEDICKYDENGRVIETAQEGRNWHHTLNYFEYEAFDDKGNWTTVVWLNKDHKLAHYSFREIKYAD